MFTEGFFASAPSMFALACAGLCGALKSSVEFVTSPITTVPIALSPPYY